MFDFVYFIALVWVYYRPTIITIYVICTIAMSVYLKVTGYDKWYLGFVPAGSVFYKYELAGVNPLLTVSEMISNVLFFLTFDPISCAAMLILRILSNYKFASIYVDLPNPAYYSCLPFAKYVIIVKEIYDLCKK